MRGLLQAPLRQRGGDGLDMRPCAAEQAAEPVEKRDVGHGCSPDAATGNTLRMPLY
jgi:hypothetical protein